MKVIYDPILKKKRKQDTLGNVSSIRFEDTEGGLWDMSIIVDGSILVHEVVTSTNIGMPMGLLLTLTYS